MTEPKEQPAPEAIWGWRIVTLHAYLFLWPVLLWDAITKKLR